MTMKRLAIAAAALASTAIFAGPSWAAVQVATLNSGNPIITPPEATFLTDMNWASTGTHTGIVQFTLGNSLTLSMDTDATGGFVNTGFTDKTAFNFTDISLYVGNYESNGNSLVGLTELATTTTLFNMTGWHAAGILPITLSAGNYTLAYTGTVLSTPAVNAPVRVSGNVTFAAAAIPEAATWAMMVIGFGAVGGALRGSRRKTAVSFG